MRCRQRQFTASVRIISLSGVSGFLSSCRVVSFLISLFHALFLSVSLSPSRSLHALTAKCRGASLTEHHHKLTNLQQWDPTIGPVTVLHTAVGDTPPRGPPPPSVCPPTDPIDRNPTASDLSTLRASCSDIESIIGRYSRCFGADKTDKRMECLEYSTEKEERKRRERN